MINNQSVEIEKNKPKRSRFGWLTVIVLSGLYLLIYLNKQSTSLLDLSLASLIYLFCCLPTLIYFYKSERTMPFLPIFGIVYFIYYGLPLFTQYKLFLDSGFIQEEITKTLGIALSGIISLEFSFYVFSPILCRPIPQIKIPWQPKIAFRLAIFMGFLGLFVHYASYVEFIPLYLGVLASYLTQLTLFSIAILYTLQLQKKLYLFGKLILWGCFFPLRVLLNLSSGFLTAFILSDTMIFLFVYIQQLKRIPWKGVIIITMLFFILFSVKEDFRYLTWYDGSYIAKKPLEKAFIYLQLAYDKISGKKTNLTYSYEELAGRTNSLIMFTKVVSLTPAYIPYWDGYTYRTLLISLVPRFIVRDKPTKILGQDFGHRYGFLDPWDLSTSCNLPLLIEFYINFGILGVAIGMLLLGFIYCSFYRLLNHEKAGEGGILLGLMVFINLLSIETDFSLMFGAIIQYLILFYIIIRFTRLPITRTVN